MTWALLLTASLLALIAVAALRFRRRALATIDQLRAARDQCAAQMSALVEARDQAVANASAKSGFLAAMSHEIRTPMSGVVGMLSLLSETRLDSKQREFVRTATSSGGALLTIIDDILDTSRIEAGKLSLERIDFDLRPVVEDVAQLLAQKAHAKGIELTCLVDRRVPDRLNGDPARLRQVLLNLGGNAVKFTAQGAVRIRAEVDIEVPRGVALRFEVGDSGIGMTEQAQAGLFQAFSQAEVSTSRRFGGSGLGLSISRGLVELMGGRIGFSSAEGTGSNVWFTAQYSEAVTLADQPPSALLAGVRVMVVDPSEASREVYSHDLEPRGAMVLAAADAQSARAALHTGESSPDLVLIDAAIPAADRVAVLRSIRDDPRHAKVRLFLVVPLGSPASPPTDQAGFDGLLAKPIRRQVLIEAIRPGRGVADLVARADPSHPAPLLVVRSGGKPIRVLLAEDHEVNRLLVVEVLTRAGVEIDLACNGAEAVEARFNASHDVLLMDCQMPVMDGFEATTAIRAREATGHHPPVPIVALTASATAADREKCLATGMTDYVAKPFVPATLLAAVSRAACCDLVPSDRLPSSAPLSAGEPIDLRHFEDVVGSDPEKACHFLAMFRDRTAAGLLDIESALDSGDGDNVRQLAHKLKGSTGMIGARQVSALAAEIELLAAAGRLESVGPVLHRLKSAFRAAERFAVTRSETLSAPAPSAH